jgi:phosphatidylinositol alpha-mannosyltransferase
VSRRRSLRVGLACPYALDTPGGVQSHVLGLAAYLRELGHDPYVLAPGALPADALGLDEAHFTSAGAPVPVRYNGSVARVVFGPLSAARARRWCARPGFDLLHVHEPITPSVALLALWAAEVPVVATFHTATPRSRSMQLAGHALAAAVDKIDAGIAVSEVAREVVVRHLGRDAVIIPNGFPLAAFAAPARSAVSPPEPLSRPEPVEGRWRDGDRPRLVFLGRLDEPRKGLDVLLAALPALRRAHPDLDVVVAGQGQRVLPPGCRSVGAVSEAEKAALLAGADVFVAPHTERESFGIVLLEAMASGAPVVASDLVSFADLLTAGDRGPAEAAGHLFRSGDADALGRAVLGVLARPEHPETERARLLVARYDWSSVGAAVLAVYEAVLAATSVEGAS